MILTDMQCAKSFVSVSFHCCGDRSSSDIIDQQNVAKCCQGLYARESTILEKVVEAVTAPGCTQLVIDGIKRSERNYILLPSFFMLIIEFVVLGWTWFVAQQIVIGNVYY